jgi:hypothetical protein
VCEKNQMLTPEQAKILKLISRPLATFRVNVECCVTKEDGFEAIKMPKSDKKSLRKPMKAKEKLQLKNSKKSKEDVDSAMMEIIEGSESEEDDDEEMDESD